MTDRLESCEGTVATRLADLRSRQKTLGALQDAHLCIDDGERFEQTKALIEASLLVARHRLETAPPENLVGVTLLLRYGLSITDNPRLASVIKACLVTLLKMEASRACERVDQIPDEAFDAAVNWLDVCEIGEAEDLLHG